MTLYRIHAALLCHDVRLNTSVETKVWLDHYPSEIEAIRILSPIAEQKLVESFCEGCLYDLTVTEIEAIETK